MEQGGDRLALVFAVLDREIGNGQQVGYVWDACALPGVVGMQVNREVQGILKPGRENHRRPSPG